MLSKYWRNTVITSVADFYCLACESYLRTTNDVDAHIEKPVHTKKLESTPYYDKYKHDLIREISSGYFCEACNLLYATDLEVDLHVVEATHAANLSNQLLKRSGNTIFAYDEISIDEKAWAGFIGTTCVLCKTKVTDENIHKNQQNHILNLIQSKYEFWQGKAVYRQVNNNLQCLTCNELVQISTKSTHSELTEHKKQYEDHRRVSNNSNNVDVGQACHDTNNSNNAVVDQAQPDVQEQAKLKKIKSKKTNEAAIQKKDKATAKKETEKSDADDIEDYIINVLGAKNYITNKDNKKWCLLCDWALDDCSEKQHVKSSHHLTILKLHKERIAKKNAAGADDDEPISENDEPDTDDDNSDDRILDAIDDFGRNGIKVNLETRSVHCRKCSENVDYNYDSIKNHIDEHNKKNNKKDASKFDWKEKDDAKGKTLYTKQVTIKKGKSDNNTALTEELINFAKKHDLILKNNKYYCSICSISVTANMKDVKDHIASTGHKNRQIRKSKTPEKLSRSYAVKLPIKDFIKVAHIMENMFFNDIVINDKYCISLMSFYLFTKHSHNTLMVKCQLCDAVVPLQQVDLHKDIPHAEKMQDIWVITSVPDEFLRQLRGGDYHCGICNLVLKPDELDDHLDSTSHKETRTAAQCRLERYLPELMEKRREKVAEVMFLQMLAGFRN